MNEFTIRAIHARRVWDSRGRPTVEAEVTLAGDAMGRAIVPAGASRGTREALELRDGIQPTTRPSKPGRLAVSKANPNAAPPPFGGLDVSRAVEHVNGEIARALIGAAADDQAALDQRLIDLDGTPNKSRLGANATLAVSMAAAHAVASARGVPLYEQLAFGSGLAPAPGSAPASAQSDDTVLLPMPQVQIFGGGAHAGRRVDVQDFMVVCPGAKNFAQAMEWTAEVYRCAGELMRARRSHAGVADEGGWWPDFSTNEQALETLVAAIERAAFTPGRDVAIALDIAASEFGRGGRYRLALEALELDSDALAEMLLRWIDRYPIVSIEDPFAEDDLAGFARFTRATAGRVQIVGDDLLVTDARLVREAAAAGAANTVLLKPNQRGTLTETLHAWRAAQEVGYAAIVSARSGETEDTTIVHLAVGWRVGQLKIGSFARSERMAKWNEAIRIEERAGSRARFEVPALFRR